jgi:hypothetical protein
MVGGPPTLSIGVGVSSFNGVAGGPSLGEAVVGVRGIRGSLFVSCLVLVLLLLVFVSLLLLLFKGVLFRGGGNRNLGRPALLLGDSWALGGGRNCRRPELGVGKERGCLDRSVVEGVVVVTPLLLLVLPL